MFKPDRTLIRDLAILLIGIGVLLVHGFDYDPITATLQTPLFAAAFLLGGYIAIQVAWLFMVCVDNILNALNLNNRLK